MLPIPALQSLTDTDWISEVSGSLGDLGTLIPVLVALSKTGQISLSASFVFGGVFNILTGLVYDIPMCVQPMKAIAAVALSAKLSPGEISSAGLFVSVVVGILGISGLISLVSSKIPLCIVRGIQVGTGLTLVTKGIDMVSSSNGWNLSDRDAAYDNYVWTILAFATGLAFYHARRNLSALILFGVGILLAVIHIRVNNAAVGKPGFVFSSPSAPNASEFYYGIISAGLGQVPLTLLNSIIATSFLANDLFPLKSHPVASVKSISLCVAGMNLIGCWFGSVPYCHGSGGLAGQYRFGARGGASVIFLGALKMILGLFFSRSLLSLFTYLPSSILGCMLCIAGFELASVIRDLHRHYLEPEALQNAFLSCLVTTGSILGFKNDGIGFLCGMATWFVLDYGSQWNRGIPIS